MGTLEPDGLMAEEHAERYAALTVLAEIARRQMLRSQAIYALQMAAAAHNGRGGHAAAPEIYYAA